MLNLKFFLLVVLMIIFSGCSITSETVTHTPTDSEIPSVPSIPSQNYDEPLSGRGKNETALPLSLPEGFTISTFAKNLPGARVMAMDSLGNIWVSRTKEGIISLIEIRDNAVLTVSDVFKGLKNPHGLAFDPEDPFVLYYAEEDKISQVRVYSEGDPKKVIDLPDGDRHVTRTIHFGRDEKLYVSIGSTCDTCKEKDERHATVYVLDKDGKNFKKFAGGLRNAVFMATHPVTGDIWVTEMGRDLLGTDVPPDEINILKENKNYGWPYCYGKNIHDAVFEDTLEAKEACKTAEPPFFELEAHVAPLGLTFIPEKNWPKAYNKDLLIAYHGSMDKETPKGYKIVRLVLNDEGKPEKIEDFIAGWLTDKEVHGRPVDMLIAPSGEMYISDDKNGVLYKVIYQNDSENDTENAPSDTPGNDLGNDSDSNKEPDQTKTLKLEITTPSKNQEIAGPLTIEGKATGPWFFEGSFSIKLLDGNGQELASANAEAQSAWTTTDLVPFKAQLTFKKPTTTQGKLVFMKANPSGLPENEHQETLDLKFK